MPKITFAFAAALVLLGIVAFVATGSTAKTALIPTWVGLVFALLAALALKPGLRKHVMHAAAALGLLLALGGLGMGLPKVIKMATGGEVERPAAAVSQTVMGVLAVIFVALCVRSFKAARRNRLANGR